MSDVQRLRSWFEQGDLVRPGQGCASSVDLIRALYRRCGDDGLPGGGHVRALERALGPHANYLFVLIDGLGAAIAERWSRGGFFTRCRHGVLEPVFPPTTAAAITSFATGRHPARHGVATWWVHLPEHGVTATMLPFVERFGGASLLDHGVDPGEAFPVPSRLPGLGHEVMQILPVKTAESVYSDYLNGGGARVGYASPREAFALARERIRGASGKTFTWLYLPGLDGAAHTHGVGSEAVAEEVALYESLLDELQADLGGAVRIVATADHGLVDVPDDARHILTRDDPLLELLEFPPSGEPAVPVFHVKDGQADRFAAAFRQRLGERFALLTIDEVEELELLGPGPLSAVIRPRLGDFLAIAHRPTVLLYEGETGGPPVFRGYHAGLTPEEMSVPLLLA